MRATTLRKMNWDRVKLLECEDAGQASVLTFDSVMFLTWRGIELSRSSAWHLRGAIQINRASDGVQLFADGNSSFKATALDSGQSSGIGSDSLALTVYDKNGVVFKNVAATLLGGGNVVAHLR